MSADPQYEIACPMPGCDEPLFIDYEGGYGLGPEDLVEPRAVPPGDVHNTTWKVACHAGHVILLPDEYARCCDDPGGTDCTHDWEDYDLGGDGDHQFRKHDGVRLAEAIEKLRGAR